MPLVRREIAGPAGAQPDLAADLAALLSADPQDRWAAARALGGRAEAVPALAAALAVEREASVREAIMTALMRIGDAASVRVLLPNLRAQDAAARAAAIEALQAMPAAVQPFMAALLADDDPDVRLLATELVRNLPDADATRLLCEVLVREAHPNVCAAAIEVLAEVGTFDAVPILEACARRFADSPFVPFAASAAIAQICGARQG